VGGGGAKSCSGQFTSLFPECYGEARGFCICMKEGARNISWTSAPIPAKELERERDIWTGLTTR